MTPDESPAFPWLNPVTKLDNPGLTKRELIAAMAMQALIANQWSQSESELEDYAKDAFDMADALLKELSK